MGTMVEDEVRDRAGTPYFLRILPYRVTQRVNGHAQSLETSAIEGVVLTLTDMTALDKARTRLAAAVRDRRMVATTRSSAQDARRHDHELEPRRRAAVRLHGRRGHRPERRMLMAAGNHGELAEYLRRIANGEAVEHAASLSRHKDGHRTTCR